MRMPVVIAVLAHGDTYDITDIRHTNEIDYIGIACLKGVTADKTV